MHEERLVLDDDMLRRFFANHSEGLVLVNLEGTCVLANRTVASMLGYSAEEAALSPSDFHKSVSQGLMLADATLWDPIRAGDDIVNHQMELLNKKGEHVSVLVNGTIVEEGADGNRLALVSVTNITEYKQKEDELLNKGKQSAMPDRIDGKTAQGKCGRTSTMEERASPMLSKH